MASLSTDRSKTIDSDPSSFELNGVRNIVPQSSGLAHPSPHINSFADLVLIRHSTRYFLPDPVSPVLLRECLALAQHAPSNSNIQPWRLFLATGKARTRLCSALTAAASAGPPQIPSLPDQYRHFRSEFGRLLYGASGYNISREDKNAQLDAQRRNFDFFGAPACGVVCIDKSLDPWDVMTVGMWLQTLLLALTERGLGTCLEVSVIGYPDVLRKELEIPNDMLLICGLAIGWPIEDHRVNKIDAGREAFDAHMKWMEN